MVQKSPPKTATEEGAAAEPEEDDTRKRSQQKGRHPRSRLRRRRTPAARKRWRTSQADQLQLPAPYALTRAQQALRTSARIAREAAVSFESELDNVTAAQKEIEKAFGKAE